MKFTENSLVVDVVKISNSSFKLSVPAGDLMTAAMNGAVLRRHDLSTAAVPNVLYVPLSEAKLQSGTYTFTFASGDIFTASAADAYPAASSVSDETGGGSGGGVLVVHEDDNGVLDKTWQEIVNAVATTGAAIVTEYNGAIVKAISVSNVGLSTGSGKYRVYAGDTEYYECASASGYPSIPEDDPVQ